MSWFACSLIQRVSIRKVCVVHNVIPVEDVIFRLVKLSKEGLRGKFRVYPQTGPPAHPTL